MRPIHLSDLHYAACALKNEPEITRPATLQSALANADTADRYRKRLRRAHPDYGTGTLTSALAQHHPIDDTTPHTTAYLQSMLVVITGLLTRAAAKH
ncbi:hypothetical protein FHS72_001680 [Loktanella ponticola]|uniref:DUF7742 domain-containing protein n=1 Tax=Yoonia ponticola TaxID=1524255 RepID=A0A7W9BKK7_9RHOB|nr:hypothetical protein [Yoonia ponticola]MBB5722056.1 hypothetical protein [Yoonia ponticola]